MRPCFAAKSQTLMVRSPRKRASRTMEAVHFRNLAKRHMRSPSGKREHPSCDTPSDQVLPGDDFPEPGVVGDELLDEFMHAVLENVIHVAVLEPVADAAGVALRGALPAVGDADL